MRFRTTTWNCAAFVSLRSPSARTDLVHRVETGDPRAMEQIYGILMIRMRPHVEFELGEDEADEVMHEALLVIVDHIRGGLLRDSSALHAFIESVVKNLTAARIVRAVRLRKLKLDLVDVDLVLPSNIDLEAEFGDRERTGIVALLMRQLRKRDAEILRRFYLDEQPFRQICDEMDLTETQFRLFKNRAMARLAIWVGHYY